MSWEIFESFSKMETDMEDFLSESKDLKNSVLNNEDVNAKNQEIHKDKEEVFWWVVLKKYEEYEVPWVSKSERLTKSKWVTQYKNSLVITKDWKSRLEPHKETFYSQKKLSWEGLNIPWRHIAKDGTIRDKDWYICVAANYLPKWSRIMTTLWPWKVYDRWWMKGKWIDLYVNW